MRDGFIKVAAGTPKIRVADCDYNAGQIIALMREAAAQGVKVLALPELCVTGYTCGDLFLQPTLLDGAERALGRILEETKGLDMLTALGMPVRYQNKLYNCALVIRNGEIFGAVPKTYIPSYGEFYESRWFTTGELGAKLFQTKGLVLCDNDVPFHTKQVFHCEDVPNFIVGVEICEDLWATTPPSVKFDPGRGHHYFKPVRQRRGGRQSRLPPSACNGAVGAADVRLCLCGCRGGGKLHRFGVLRP